MLKAIRFPVIIALICFVSACQKDVQSATSTGNDKITDESLKSLSALTPVVSSNHWIGEYLNQTALDTSGNNPGPAGVDPDISDHEFIVGGVARLPGASDILFFSSFSFDMPSEYNLPGDSIIFEAIVKNTREESYTDYDVMLQITGDQHSAGVHFVADNSYKSYNGYSVGSKSFNNLTPLVHYFGDFETIKLSTKQGQTGVYINNKLVYHFKYNAADRIGRIKTISIIGKGYITVDNVKLTNSVTNKKLMLENFNTTGESHGVFY